MTMKRWISALLAVLICSVAAFAQAEDLQAQLDAANRRIAELEAEIAIYKPVYDSQVVASFRGGVIFRDEAMAQYKEQAELMRNSYGFDIESYGMGDMYKQMILENMVQDAILMLKAEELGLTEIDEATLSGLENEAQQMYETYVASVADQMKEYYGETEAEGGYEEEAAAYLQEQGMTAEDILEDLKHNLVVSERIYNEAVKDVAVTEEDVRAYYDQLVETQKQDYQSDDTYNADRSAGEMIVFNPEGYRAVKQVLIKFDDDQDTRMDELSQTLTSLNAELDAAEHPEEAAEAEAEAAEAEAEPAEGEEKAEPRPVEEIRADIAEIEAEMDALYEELMPEVQEAVDAFNAGTPIGDLIAQYNDDPGMTQEPTASIGYAVKADSTAWDPAFTEAAMSIAEPGQISEPTRGHYGFYIVYYDSDIVPGEVDYASVRDELESKAYSAKASEAYDAAIAAWTAEAEPRYFLENMK